MNRIILCILVFFTSLSAYEWISVNDELPKKNQKVLIWDATGQRIEFAILNEYWRFYYFIHDCPVEITHWMPLPNPPE